MHRRIIGTRGRSKEEADQEEEEETDQDEGVGWVSRQVQPCIRAAHDTFFCLIWAKLGQNLSPAAHVLRVKVRKITKILSLPFFAYP